MTRWHWLCSSSSIVIFKALACDYDGTLANDDTIGPETLAALREARKAGLRLILVTGRTFFELTRVCEPLDLFDAVVAENGAVVYYPQAGAIQDQAPPPPPRLLAELDRRGIYFQMGRVIVGTARTDEERVREAMAGVGVSLRCVYNRGALMLLPAGISKGSGVRQVIRALGLSFHDVLALGDAENDLDFFEACGWAGCPSNAVAPLAAQADWVFPGHDGDAIARAVVGSLLPGGLPLDLSPRHRVPLGWVVESAEPVTIPERGINVLVQGDPLSGKSWLTGSLVERLLGRRYAICVIDPEGDYRVLASLPGVTWVEIQSKGAIEQALAPFDRDPAACVVADLSNLAHGDKVQGTETALLAIRDLRRRGGRPHWVVLDEAHYSLHREGVADAAVGFEDKGFCLATYKASWLRESVTQALDVVVLARTTAPEELFFIRRLLAEAGRSSEGVVPVLRDLPRGEFVLVRRQRAGDAPLATFAATPRETPHVRHLTKYADTCVPPERRFFFRRGDGRVLAAADSLNEFRQALVSIDDDVLAHHARRGDFSRWVLEVFSDPHLAGQLHKVEARWARGEITDLRHALERPVALRYGALGDRKA